MISNSILLVDDDIGFLKVYSKILERNGYLTAISSNGRDALGIIERTEPDLIITDMYMPEMGGLEFIRNVRKINKDTKILVVTGDGTIENAVEAMKLGAFSYIQKPINIDEFLLEIEKALNYSSAETQNRFMRKIIDEKNDSFIGECEEIINIKNKIDVISETDSTVIIYGESGAGKELVAQRIHYLSRRGKFPMVKINCSALSSNLLESELFGHEKGAFTGAIKLKKGLFEIAGGSTLFLDEVGEMPLDMQAKLLRVLQEKEFRRVGGNVSLNADFRLICATNKDLKSQCDKGDFRNDLYYRINVIPINLPPLRERKGDIRLLTDYFLKNFSMEMGRNIVKFKEEVYDAIENYKWSGNIRELKNIIERLTVFFNGDLVGVEKLPWEIIGGDETDKNKTFNLESARDNFEKGFIEKALMMNEYNVTKTSINLGIARKNLYKKIKKYNIIIK